MKATGFREYDARWIFGDEINFLGVQALGLGLGTFIHELGQNRVVVGEQADLLAPGLRGERLHWIGPAPEAPEGHVEATVKIRSRHPGVAARIRPLG